MPRDLGIIGVDNSRIARITAPTLTSIDFDLEFSAASLVNQIVLGKSEIDSSDLVEVERRLRVVARESSM